MTRVDPTTPRAETVGSLLQPRKLLDARTEYRAGQVAEDALRAIEDEAVVEAIALQEGVGLDVITDGEMRRATWADTLRHLDGIESRPGVRSYPANVRLAGNADTSFPTVVRKVSVKPGPRLGEEYPFLAGHATARTKYTMAAPSYHRRYWSETVSAGAYGSCEEFLTDVRDWLRDVAAWLVSQGCTYLQLDAPNYGSLCDPDNRAFHAGLGHDLDEQVAFDAKLDSSVFDGLAVTRALHVCRGNFPGGGWHSAGGYGAIAEQLFPNLDVDAVLLEYDSERAGDFTALELVPPTTVAVLGLLTTKAALLEDAGTVEARVAEAAKVKPLEELAVSTQCGFASAANAPMTLDDERAKLALVADIAHRVWS